MKIVMERFPSSYLPLDLRVRRMERTTSPLEEVPSYAAMAAEITATSSASPIRSSPAAGYRCCCLNRCWGNWCWCWRCLFLLACLPLVNELKAGNQQADKYKDREHGADTDYRIYGSCFHQLPDGLASSSFEASSVNSASTICWEIIFRFMTYCMEPSVNATGSITV